MKQIVIIGAGGFAREVKFLLEEINKTSPTYEFLGYLVSDINTLGNYDSKNEVLGEISWLSNRENICAAIGIGAPQHRLNIGRDISNKYPNIVFPPLIHPNVIYDSDSCVFEKGTIICASTVLTVNVKVMAFSLVNLCCTIGHEAIIGSGCVLNPTVNISGGVHLDASVLIGTGSQILQYIKVGKNSIVGAGACVTKNIPDNVVAFGVPAKVIKKINE